APSHLDFFYNSFGNVLCFVPFGIFFPIFPAIQKFCARLGHNRSFDPARNQTFVAGISQCYSIIAISLVT
ncbi:MAG: hypothetical protein ACFN39_11555, partial [Lacticaseibacillus rhamnosus]